MKNNLFLAFRIWLVAQLIYLVLSSFTLFFEPALFFWSEAYAFCLGVPALFVFAFCMNLLIHQCHRPSRLFNWMTILSVIITFVATLCAAYHFSPNNFWTAWLRWCMFPIAAMLSALVAVTIHSKRIRQAVAQPQSVETIKYYTPE